MSFAHVLFDGFDLKYADTADLRGYIGQVSPARAVLCGSGREIDTVFAPGSMALVPARP
jgi:hypothetical protein